MFQAGQQIGVYKLVKKLAKGGFGEVWLAEKQSEFVTKKFAIKLPLDEQVDFDAIRQEATIWEQASGHLNVVPLIDADVYDGQVAITSEYVEGGSLADKLKTAGSLPIIEAVDIVIGILSGLDFLHAKNIIHRDVKPQNILMQGDTPRLTDFGISRAISATKSSSTIVGTESYMAPESFEGVRSIQTDIWSVGVLLYKLITGRLPFPQNNPSEIMYGVIMTEPAPLPKDIPDQLQKIIFKALEKDRDLNGEPPQRYQSAIEMREDLLDFIEIYSQSLTLPEVVLPPHPQTEEPTRVKLHIPTTSSPWANIRQNLKINLLFVVLLSILGIFILGSVAVQFFSSPPLVTANANLPVATTPVQTNSSSNSINSAENVNSVVDNPVVLGYAAQAYKLFQQKKYDQAIKTYGKAIEISPDDYALYNDRGLIYYTKRKYNEAIADFDKSIELKPASLTYNNRGVAYEDKGNKDKAIEDYRKAIELDPANEQASKNLEKILK